MVFPSCHTQSTSRARARPKSHPWTGPSLLMPHPFQEESKLGILESDIATRLASAPEGATAAEIDTECTFLTGMEKRLISTQAEVAGGPDRQKTPGLQAGWSLKS